MLTIKNYVKVKSLEEAYELNQKKSNRVIGGMLWLRLSDLRVQTAIDLSGLGLDQIEETEEAFSIGCMTTLRQLELHGGLDCYTGGALRESLRHIVGVQFRNLATVGGSIYGRFGFSDVLTMFLVLDTYVELYRGGILPLKEFLARKKRQGYSGAADREEKAGLLLLYKPEKYENRFPCTYVRGVLPGWKVPGGHRRPSGSSCAGGRGRRDDAGSEPGTGSEGVCRSGGRTSGNRF